MQLRTNSHSLTTPSYDALGSALDMMVAKANHSCDPNAYVIMDGPVISIRTIRPIALDEEIFITYLDTTEPYYMRQHALQKNWFFTCNCAKCQDGPAKEDSLLHVPSEEVKEICRALKKPPIADVDTKSSFHGEADSVFVDEKNFHRNNPDSEVLSIAQMAFRRHADLALAFPSEKEVAMNLHHVFALWSRADIWPKHRYPMLYVRNELVLANIEAGQRYQAMLHASKIHFEIYPVIYPEPHMLMRVVNAFRLAKLLLDILFDGMMNGSITREDLHFPVLIWGILRDLVKDVDKSHGEDSRFSKMVKEKRDEFSTGPNSRELNAYYEAPGIFEREKHRLLQTVDEELKKAERKFVRNDEPLPRQFKRMEEMLDLAASKRWSGQEARIMALLNSR